MASDGKKRVIGALLGAVVGFVASGFNPVGLFQGFVQGYTLAAAFEKEPEPDGPRLEKLEYNESKYGTGIPRLYGRDALSANIFWMQNNQLKEIKNGPEYNYFATFAVGLCEGPITRVRKVWANEELIYEYKDPSSNSSLTDSLRKLTDNVRAVTDTFSDFTSNPENWFNLDPKEALTNFGETFQANLADTPITFTTYRGDYTQQPDSSMVEEFGDDAPGYRGLAYIVFKDLKLTNETFGNRLPTLKFVVEVNKEMVEITTQAVQTASVVEVVSEPKVRRMAFFDELDAQRNPGIQGWYSFAAGEFNANPFQAPLGFFDFLGNRVPTTQLVKFSDEENCFIEMSMIGMELDVDYSSTKVVVINSTFGGTALNYLLKDRWVSRRKMSAKPETITYPYNTSEVDRFEFPLVSEEVFKLNKVALPPLVGSYDFPQTFQQEVEILPIQGTDEYVAVYYRPYNNNSQAGAFVFGIGYLTGGEIVVTAIPLPEEMERYSGVDYLSDLYSGYPFYGLRRFALDPRTGLSTVQSVYHNGRFYFYCDAALGHSNDISSGDFLKPFDIGRYFPGLLTIKESALNRKPLPRSNRQPIFNYKTNYGFNLYTAYDHEVYNLDVIQAWASTAVMAPSGVRYYPKLVLSGLFITDRTLYLHTFLPNTSNTQTAPPVGQIPYALWTTDEYDIPGASSVPKNSVWSFNPYADKDVSNSDLQLEAEVTRDIDLLTPNTSAGFFKGFGVTFLTGPPISPTNEFTPRYAYLNDQLIDLAGTKDASGAAFNMSPIDSRNYSFGGSPNYLQAKKTSESCIAMSCQLRAGGNLWDFNGTIRFFKSPSFRYPHYAYPSEIFYAITEEEFDNIELTEEARVTAEAVTVEEYLSLEMARTSLLTADDFDFSEGTDFIKGLVIANRAPIKNTLSALQDAFLFDIIQEDYKIQVKKRQIATLAAVIPEADLGVVESGQTPVIIHPTVIAKYDRPSFMSLKYRSEQLDYETDTIQVNDPSVDHLNFIDFSVPLVLDSNEAYRVLDQYAREIDSSYKGAFEINTSFKYSHLEPGNFIQVALDTGAIYPLRIIEIHKGRPGIVRIKGVIDYPEAYNSDKASYINSEVNSTGQEVTFSGSRIFQTLAVDSWPLVAEQEGAGFYFFGGYNTNETIDINEKVNFTFFLNDKLVYRSLLRGFSSIISVLNNTLPVISTEGDFDYRGSIQFFPTGNYSFVSKTEEEVRETATTNLFFLGTPGSWEMVKITSFSTDITTGLVTATGFLRGYKGTSIFQKPADNTDLSIGLSLIPISGYFDYILHNSEASLKPAQLGSGYQGTDLLTYKPQDGNPVRRENYNYATISLTPVPPTHLAGYYSAQDQGYRLDWVRQARYGIEWENSVDITLEYDFEQYVVFIYDTDDQIIAQHTVQDQSFFEYTDALQVADFGTIQSTIKWTVAQRDPGRGVIGLLPFTEQTDKL